MSLLSRLSYSSIYSPINLLFLGSWYQNIYSLSIAEAKYIRGACAISYYINIILTSQLHIQFYIHTSSSGSLFGV